MVAIGLADPGCSAIVPFGILGLVVQSAGPTPKGNWPSPFATIVCSPRVRSRTTRSIPYPPRSSRRLVWETRNDHHHVWARSRISGVSCAEALHHSTCKGHGRPFLLPTYCRTEEWRVGVGVGRS